MIPRLLLVTDRLAMGGRDLVETVAAAAAGGVDAVQVREKDLPDAELARLVEKIQRAVAGRALVLVNSRLEVASALGAGLHLAANVPTPMDRGWPLWGRSVHSASEALDRANRESPDYLLIGNVYATSSKPGLPGGGLSLVKETAEAVAPRPVLSIGGIDATNAGAVIAAGAAGVAIRGAILNAPDPERAALCIRESLI